MPPPVEAGASAAKTDGTGNAASASSSSAPPLGQVREGQLCIMKLGSEMRSIGEKPTEADLLIMLNTLSNEEMVDLKEDFLSLSRPADDLDMDDSD